MNFQAFLRVLSARLLLLAAILFPGGSGVTAQPADEPTTTASASRSGSDTALQVMSFNIRYGTARDGADRWEVRKPRLIEVMRRHPAQVVGLQEALIGQIDDLRAAFPRYQVVGVGRSDGNTSGEFSAILYDTGRLQLLRSDTFWLSETPRVPGSKHWGNTFERICTWAHFRDLKGGGYFYVYNTHLDHQSQPSREKGTDLILRRIASRRPEDPVILTGDLNADEINPVNQRIRKAEFRDTFRVLHPDATEVGTTNGFRPKRGEHKIDYIFVDSSWSVKQADIVADQVDGRWPSDHLPVTATVLRERHSRTAGKD